MDLTLHVEEDGSGRTTAQTVEAAPGDTVADILDRAGISRETVIVERDGTVITAQDTITAEDDALRVLRVVSGG